VDWLSGQVEWTDEFNRVLNSDADIIVELIGGIRPAEDWIRSALLAGKSVVTANKQLMAQCGPELLSLAAEQGCQLAFGATVAGGVPVISALQDGLAGDEIVNITGILNGTCNYILSEMERSSIRLRQLSPKRRNADMQRLIRRKTSMGRMRVPNSRY